jgi:putative tryptophan/tyrosine transport system substrate-binding protein
MVWPTRKTILATLLSLVAVLSVDDMTASVEAGDRIAVLVSFRGAPVDQTLEGFQAYLRKQGIAVSYDSYSLEADSDQAAQSLRRMKSSKPSLIFALGSRATEASVKEYADIPIIAGMISRPDPLKKAANGTGVFLEFPAETQLKWLQRFLPNTKNVGVIYNYKENHEWIGNAVRSAQDLTLNIEGREIRSPEDLPSALNALARTVDVLWGVADNLVLNSQTAKQVLLFSFRNSIPFIGLSSTWVKAGALYSLEGDYTDQGTQCGEMALRVLRGTKPSLIPPVPPRKIKYSLNLNTAEHMKIKISPKLIEDAYLTY